MHAFPLKSVYTTLDLANCQKVKIASAGSAWVCRGLEGYPVYLAESELHVFVSFGGKAATTRAATQTLKPSNSVFLDGSTRTTIEWRFVRRDGRVVPFATIVRYVTSNDAVKGQILVVSRVTPREVCHLAYVDALANDDAIQLARKAADESARSWKCDRDPIVIGKVGRSPL